MLVRIEEYILLYHLMKKIHIIALTNLKRKGKKKNHNSKRLYIIVVEYRVSFLELGIFFSAAVPFPPKVSVINIL